MATTIMADLATERQKSFILTLSGERGVTLPDGWLDTISRAKASKAIEKLISMPKVERPQAPTQVQMVTVPAGHYALTIDDGVKFYRVDCPNEGRWAGRVFVSRQASDEHFPVKNPDERRAILTAIAADPQAASALYGHELGVCGVCGRTLTNEESREIGIGPVCRAKQGWQ